MPGRFKLPTHHEWKRVNRKASRTTAEGLAELDEEFPEGEQPPGGGGGTAPPPPPDEWIKPPGVQGIALSTGVAADGTVFIDVTYVAVSQAKEYEIRWKRDGEPAYSYAATTDTTFRIEGLVANVLYLVGVQSINGKGFQSGYGDDSQITTAQDTTPPGVPTGLNVVAGLKNVISWWTANPEADFSHYLVKVSTAGTDASQVSGSPFRSDTTVFNYEPSVGTAQATFHVALGDEANASLRVSVNSLLRLQVPDLILGNASNPGNGRLAFFNGSPSARQPKPNNIPTRTIDLTWGAEERDTLIDLRATVNQIVDRAANYNFWGG